MELEGKLDGGWAKVKSSKPKNINLPIKKKRVYVAEANVKTMPK